MFFCHAHGVHSQDLFGVFFRRLEKAEASGSWEPSTKTVHGDSLLERLFIRSMVVLLKTLGNCSCLRAKVAHMVAVPTGCTTSWQQASCIVRRTDEASPSSFALRAACVRSRTPNLLRMLLIGTKPESRLRSLPGSCASHSGPRGWNDPFSWAGLPSLDPFFPLKWPCHTLHAAMVACGPHKRPTACPPSVKVAVSFAFRAKEAERPALPTVLAMTVPYAVLPLTRVKNMDSVIPLIILLFCNVSQGGDTPGPHQR